MSKFYNCVMKINKSGLNFSISLLLNKKNFWGLMIFLGGGGGGGAKPKKKKKKFTALGGSSGRPMYIW